MSEQTVAGDQKVALTDRFARSETSIGESAPEDYLILDLDTGRYWGVGEVGGFVWDRLDGESDLASLAETITADFEVDPAQASADLIEFVTWLRDNGLATRR